IICSKNKNDSYERFNTDIWRMLNVVKNWGKGNTVLPVFDGKRVGAKRANAVGLRLRKRMHALAEVERMLIEGVNEGESIYKE
ncbi:hypothetical protein SARC_12789, partial [Sphaeroforma arctica JP610]